MEFKLFSEDLMDWPGRNLVKGCSTESLLQFILQYYNISKKDLALHLEVSQDELEHLLSDKTYPDSKLKDRIIELLK